MIRLALRLLSFVSNFFKNIFPRVPMAEQQINYSKINEVADDGITLFKCMMRLEFAIKEAGYVRPGKSGAAQIDWDRYANERLESDVWQQARLVEVVRPLILTPPKHQIVDGSGNLDWKGATEVSSLQDLIGAVRRVRNNLFHGGKSGDPDAERNEKLYAASLKVIDLILRKDDIVRTIFTGEY